MVGPENQSFQSLEPLEPPAPQSPGAVASYHALAGAATGAAAGAAAGATVAMGAASLIPVGALLGDRYRVVRILGQGGFGRTYLAEDLQRFDEPCVLKEFAPQVHSPDGLAKARRLFEREAGVLYRLNHDQIPRFRELRQLDYSGQPYLLLVQDFVPGRTYREVLGERQYHGKTLTEAEVALLLRQILPVLSYLHHCGVIHRDISPDNLIQRSSDGLPVLIDFGAVKQAAATLLNEISRRSEQGTRLGKLGYAPPEQMQQGAVFPHSDVYALGATALTLLSGAEPQYLMDPHSLDWTWQQQIQVSPAFAAVLNRMVALRPRDRYASAQAALGDLDRLGPLPHTPVSGLQPQGTVPPGVLPPTALNEPSPGSIPPRATAIAPVSAAPIMGGPKQTQGTVATYAIGHPEPWPATGAVAVSDRAALEPTQVVPTQPSRNNRWQGVISGLVFLLGTGLAAQGLWALQQRESPIAQVPSEVVTVPTYNAAASVPLPTPDVAEVQRQQDIEARRSELGIPRDFWADFLAERWQAMHPELGGKALSLEPDEATLRAERDKLALTWLEHLSRLAPEQRSRLGSYSNNEFEQWVRLASDRFVSRSAFLNRIDLKLTELLPELLSQGNDPTVNQVRWAIASTIVQGLRADNTVTTLTTDAAGNAYHRASLKPGQEDVHLIQLNQGQNLRISFTSTLSGLQLSLYKPSDSKRPLIPELVQQYWEGRLPETGTYEIRVRSGAAITVEYSLTLVVE